jgi:hypothetical protein
MLDNVWCLPPVVARSWWGQWGCYGRCSMPYVMYAVEGPWTCIQLLLLFKLPLSSVLLSCSPVL